MRYRKRPVVIDAIRLDKISNEAVEAFLGADERNIRWSLDNRKGAVRIITLEGTMTAMAGDWIVKGVQGEFYPVKHSIFLATYEPVEGEQP